MMNSAKKLVYSKVFVTVLDGTLLKCRRCWEGLYVRRGNDAEHD